MGAACNKPGAAYNDDGVLSIVATVLYGLSNIPFIMIQRYNRPRLVRLYKRMSSRQGGRNK